MKVMTMSSNQTTNGKLTNKDLTQIYGRYIHLNGMNDYQGQMHAGFTYSIIPALKKIYADDKEKRIDAYQRHMNEYFNVTPYLGGLPLGVVLAMEEQNAADDDFDTSTITGIKTALMGPLSAIGDTLFHATLRVIATAVVISMASAGNILGPILFMLIFNIPQFICRWWSLKSGYSMGTKLLEQAESSGIMEKISYAASVIGLAAIGAMTAFNVNLSCALTIPNAAGGDPTAVQSLFDAVCPKILPLGLVLLCYWLLAKKKVNVIPLLLGLLVVGVILRLLGIIA